MRWRPRPFRRREQDRQLDAELHDHLDRLTADYVRAGLPEAEARRRARLAFGGLEQAKEASRDVRRFAVVDDLLRDLKHGARMLRRTPVRIEKSIWPVHGVALASRSPAFAWFVPVGPPRRHRRSDGCRHR